jgi:hypothetical protein
MEGAMSVRGWAGLAAVALILAGCESVPRSMLPEPVRQVAVEHGPLAAIDVPRIGTVRIGLFTDERAIEEKARIGELHGPVVVPATGGEGVAPFAVIQFLALANPVPTGRFVTLKDAPDLPAVVAGSMRDALGQAGYTVEVDATAAPLLEGRIIEFWLRPSWTVTCDIRIELRLVDASGAVR